MPLLTPPPTPAIQRGDRSTFANRLDAFITWLINFVTEMLALVSSLNILAAGGAYTIPYMVDLSTTADGDPTPGRLRLNAGTQNAATAIYLDLFGLDGTDYTSMLDQFDASTSAVKGQIRIVKQGDPTKFLTFDVIARTAATGYRKLTVSNSGGSSANPFGPNESVLIKFTRTGDKGDSSAATPVFWAQEQKANGTAAGNSSANGISTRALNTVMRNTMGATLSGSQITLAAGTYRVRASAPGYSVDGHMLQLFEGAQVAVSNHGPNAFAAAGSIAQTTATLGPLEIVLSTSKTIYLGHYTKAAATNGLGQPMSFGGEVYSEIYIEKVA
jgi:hypothetical protein